MTKPRKAALAVMLARDPKPSFRSNVTDGVSPNGETRGLVYWQSIDWLQEQGLADFVPGTGDYQAVLTAAGRKLATGAADA